MVFPHRRCARLRCSSTCARLAQKIVLQGLLADLALQLGYPSLFGVLHAHATEGRFPMLMPLAPPAVQFTGIHLQRTRDLG
jgi:hypothetical protein